MSRESRDVVPVVVSSITSPAGEVGTRFTAATHPPIEIDIFSGETTVDNGAGLHFSIIGQPTITGDREVKITADAGNSLLKVGSNGEVIFRYIPTVTKAKEIDLDDLSTLENIPSWVILKMLRKRANLTQDDVANVMGISKATVIRREKGTGGPLPS